MTVITKKLRVLCLHGYRTNVKVMQDQRRDLRRVMAPHADFVFASAPFEARGSSDEAIERLYSDHGPFYEWGHITKVARSDNGWYHQYVGFDRVVKHIDKQVQDHGPFDAAIGFSQGGQMLTALTMWNPRARCCFASAIRTLGRLAEACSDPSIHLIGKKDQYYSTCREHANLYADSPNKWVFEHDSGHRFPSGDRHPGLYEKISDKIQQHCNN
ncbi:hypothetical protein V7S43_000576 [Phytophthora oleae]|uniref:Serine hydrolase domain-containing protein n=1 Tax=Phytophthora oleae TaxID=2107226 RepID=A0ABD3GA04_9STRA